MSDIANQFNGLPISDLIGGPLMAACEAQVALAQATSNFINTVGFEVDEKGKPLSGAMRMSNFSYDQVINGQKETMHLSVPLLTMVKVPTLAIKTVDIQFDMEVKSTTVETSKNGYDASISVKGGWGPVSASIQGSVSSSQENTRSTDNSAKYHIELHAADDGMPEGLSRVLDMLNNTIAPTKADASQITAKTEDEAKAKAAAEAKAKAGVGG